MATIVPNYLEIVQKNNFTSPENLAEIKKVMITSFEYSPVDLKTKATADKAYINGVFAPLLDIITTKKKALYEPYKKISELEKYITDEKKKALKRLEQARLDCQAKMDAEFKAQAQSTDPDVDENGNIVMTTYVDPSKVAFLEEQKKEAQRGMKIITPRITKADIQLVPCANMGLVVDTLIFLAKKTELSIGDTIKQLAKDNVLILNEDKIKSIIALAKTKGENSIYLNLELKGEQSNE